MANKYKRGFTLLELVLVLVIVSIMAGILAPLISKGMAASTVAQSGFSTLTSSNMSMQRLLRELRQIDFSAGRYDCDIMQNDDLRCTKNDSNSTQFRIRRIGSTLSVSYSVPAASATLLDSVSMLQFRYLNYQGVETTDSSQLAQIEMLIGVIEPSSGGELLLRNRVTLRDRG